MGVLDVLGKPLAPNDEKMIWENRKEDFLTNLIARESGWVIDQGGGTRFGISERAHGKDTIIWNLGPEGAKKIYRKEYLHRGEERFGRTPEALKFMDMEVNMGYENAMGVAQNALNLLLEPEDQINVDRGYGDITKKAIRKVQNNYSSQDIVNAFKKAQLIYYKGLPDFKNTGGWITRSEYDPIKED